jgi:hypothetical protein
VSTPALEHARQILRNMGWPLAGNHELVSDCIQSIAKAKGLNFDQASSYLMRAVRLAKEQGIPVTRYFFQDGMYTEVRPVTASEARTGEACRTCGDEGALRPSRDIPGLRLIACPNCAKGREQAVRLDKLNSAIQRERIPQSIT